MTAPLAQATAATDSHIPVLIDAAIEALQVRPDGTYLDGTFGRGGHARALLARLGPGARLLVMDKDPEAIECARQLVAADARLSIRQGSFANLADWNETADGLDGVLLDLGISSPQVDKAGRGFSFAKDGPLDMRMDPTSGPSAADWLARARESEIADVLWRFGEERHSRRIARAIVALRDAEPLTRTLELAALVARNTGRAEPGRHPATRTFQALRIAVNRELEDLEQGLAQATARLLPGGRLVVISFHSLEDRIVKHFLRKESGSAPAGRRALPPPQASAPRLRLVGRCTRPDAAEVARNARARSAVMRVAERLPVDRAA